MERRNFLTTAGKGAIAVSLLGGLPATAATTIDDKSIGDVISVKLPPLEQPTEKEQAVSSISLPKGKRIGYAIVGLGNLTLGQILPGFGASKYGKPVALVSGDAEKAKKIAAQYGIDPKNIYNYLKKTRDNLSCREVRFLVSYIPKIIPLFKLTFKRLDSTFKV